MSVSDDELAATVDELSEGQQRVLRFVAHTFTSTGAGPSVRQVQEHMGWKSPSSAQYHLDQLIAEGWLERDAGGAHPLRPAFDPRTGVRANWNKPTHVPLLTQPPMSPGAIRHSRDAKRTSADRPVELLPLPAQLVGTGDIFMLRVDDSAMADAGICRGDYVVVCSQRSAQLGDTVVASIGDEPATVRRFRPHGDTVALEAASSDLPVLVRRIDEVVVHGKVVAVLRKT